MIQKIQMILFINNILIIIYYYKEFYIFKFDYENNEKIKLMKNKLKIF